MLNLIYKARLKGQVQHQYMHQRRDVCTRAVGIPGESHTSTKRPTKQVHTGQTLNEGSSTPAYFKIITPCNAFKTTMNLKMDHNTAFFCQLKARVFCYISLLPPCFGQFKCEAFSNGCQPVKYRLISR